MTYTPGNVIQSSEYYPFGMQTASSWTRDNVTGNNFLGNGGTELNTTSQVYDLDYRNYDPILGRMNQTDPLADQFSSLSPYHYSYNNPIGFNDPSGALPWSNDFAENYIGSDYGSRNAWAKMVARGGMEQFVGGAGEGWDGYVGGFGLADGGFGFGSMYSNPSVVADAFYGQENAERVAARIAFKANLSRPQTSSYTGGPRLYGNEGGTMFYNGQPEVKEDISVAEKLLEATLTTGKVILDGFQFSLDVLGMVPGAGEVADGANALIYLARGDGANAALSGVAMLPIAGLGATGAKLANKAHTVYVGVKNGKEYIGITVDINKRYTATQRASMGIQEIYTNVPSRDLAPAVPQ